MIAAVDWPRFLAGYGQTAPEFFAAVAPSRRAAAVPHVAGGDPRASREALAAFVVDAAAAVLRVAADETLVPDIPLNEAGLDSLMALELRKFLASGLDLELPATLLFNFPTIDALTEYLAGQVGLAESAATTKRREPAARPAPAEAIVEEVMGMTEVEMAAVIAREFEWSVTPNG